MITDRLVITLLTGARPDLLAETLSSFREHAGDVLTGAWVVVLHNGADAATRIVLDEHGDIFDRRLVTPDVRPIGRNVTTLRKWALESHRPYWLHLEDDWKAHPVDGWLSDAVGLLNQGASQVRLRRADEEVLGWHMVTGETLVWTEIASHLWAADAHYTLNPSLTRLDHGREAWPARGEREAQRRWRKAGHTVVAQHVPGVWEHIGEERSLRKVTGCET